MIAEGLVRARLVLWRYRSERERSKFDKAGNLLFRTRTKVLTAETLTYFHPPSCLSAYLCPPTSFFYAADPLDLRREGGILLFSFIKYTDPRRDSILLGGLLFVVPSPGFGNRIRICASFSFFLPPLLFLFLFFVFSLCRRHSLPLGRFLSFKRIYLPTKAIFIHALACSGMK